MPKQPKHGGLRNPPGGRPRKPEAEKAQYIRLPIAKPTDGQQEVAVKWWNSLTPQERTKAIVELYVLDNRIE